MELISSCLSFCAWCVFSLTSAINVNDHVVVSSWRRVTSPNVVVSGYEVWVRGRSRVECIRECNKYSHCTSFVFNVSSRTCYLHPALDDTASSTYLGQVYVNTDPRCNIELAPPSNGSVRWTHTLTSLRGQVTCYDDFMKTTSDVIVQCHADGSWERVGHCLQRLWKDPPLSIFPVPPPLPVTSNWSLCMEGVPTVEERFTVELMTSDGSQPLHADFRFRYNAIENSIYVGYRLDGNYTGGQAFADFPFTVGQPFHLKIKATDQTTFEIWVDGSLRATFSQHPELPASDTTMVNVRNSVNVTRLDLWCDA